MNKLQEIYRGKAKTLFSTDDPERVILHFRDDATAFNGIKKAQLAHKGIVNNQINAFIMQKLRDAGIPVHFEQYLSPQESVVKHLTMIPVECVVRNVAAGNLCKRLGIEEGRTLEPPVFEFFLKNDALNDPMINESHIKTFNWASEQDIQVMKTLSFKVNEILKPLFANAGMLLVDYKLEFGRFNNEIMLGDEFTPDGCRIWDLKTRNILDKDRFRQDLGNVIEAYEEVAQRLGITLIE